MTNSEYKLSSDILVFPVNGGPAIQLNNKEVKYNHNNPPVITPDSNSVVYLSGAAPEDDISEIFVVPLQGGRPTLLLNKKITQQGNYYLNKFLVSHDSKTVVFSHQGATPQDTGTFSFPISGGSTNLLHSTPMNNLKISEDSTKVLFEDCTPPNRTLMADSIHGGSQLIVESARDIGTRCYFSQDFTPDGEEVIYEVFDENYKKALYGAILDAPDPVQQYIPGSLQLLLKDKTLPE